MSFNLNNEAVNALNLDDVKVIKVFLDGIPLIYAPTVTVNPRSGTMSNNTNASISVSAMANGSHISYQWLRDGVIITGATAATYTIIGAQQAVGLHTFKCMVYNGMGTVYSENSNVNIIIGSKDTLKNTAFRSYWNVNTSANYNKNTSFYTYWNVVTNANYWKVTYYRTSWTQGGGDNAQDYSKNTSANTLVYASKNTTHSKSTAKSTLVIASKSTQYYKDTNKNTLKNTTETVSDWDVL